jgi:hypothetical protein
MGPQTLSSLDNSQTEDEAQCEEEEQSHENGGKVELPKDVVLECLRPKSYNFSQ